MISPRDMAEVLPNSPLLRDFDLSKTDAHFNDWRVSEVAAGQSVLDPHINNTHLILLLEGELAVTVENQPKLPLARIQPGECVGELSILDSERPSTFVLATKASRYMSIEREALWRLMSNYPILALNLLRIMAERTREKNAQLTTSLNLMQEYRTKAETDALTGLHNRSWMMDIFPQQLDLSARIGQSVCLLMIDIDSFKQLNDTYGHAVGDLALKHLAGVMRRNLRSTDLFARYGGEEFVVMMPAASLAKTRTSAERLRRCIEETPLLLNKGANQPIGLTVSIGVAEQQPGWDLDELLTASDRALYSAKHAGRNRVCLARSPFRA